MAINKSPDASGSRVPAKPILLNLYRNFNSLITPKEVNNYRHEIGKPMLMAKDLVNPLLTSTTTPKTIVEPQDIESDSNQPSQAEKVIDFFSRETISSPTSPPLNNQTPDTHIGGIAFSLWISICLIPVVIGLANRSIH